MHDRGICAPSPESICCPRMRDALLGKVMDLLQVGTVFVVVPRSCADVRHGFMYCPFCGIHLWFVTPETSDET